MLAVFPPNRLFSVPYRHSSAPSFAANDTSPLFISWTYCFTPPKFAITIDEYPARSSLPSVPAHTCLPVFFSSTTIAAFAPPGVTTRWSPSSSGDSV